MAGQPETPADPAGTPERAPNGFWAEVLASQNRERKRLLAELDEARGLMPLLMKRRNGGRWTTAERRALRHQLAALAHLSPYLAVMALPGSFLAVPILAWWLDRRRNQRPH